MRRRQQRLVFQKTLANEQPADSEKLPGEKIEWTELDERKIFG